LLIGTEADPQKDKAIQFSAKNITNLTSEIFLKIPRAILTDSIEAMKLITLLKGTAKEPKLSLKQLIQKWRSQ